MGWVIEDAMSVYIYTYLCTYVYLCVYVVCIRILRIYTYIYGSRLYMRVGTASEVNRGE